MVKPYPFDPRDIYFSNKMCSTIILSDEYDLSGYMKLIHSKKMHLSKAILGCASTD